MTSIGTGVAQKATAKWGEEYTNKEIDLGTLVGAKNDRLYFSNLAADITMADATTLKILDRHILKVKTKRTKNVDILMVKDKK